MKSEFEIKFLNIDKQTLVEKIIAMGAQQVFPETLFKRYVLENNKLKETNAWVRLRQEEDKVTLTYKCSSSSKEISGVEEVLIEVSNLEDCLELLQLTGLEVSNYQENKREEWKLGTVTFDFDTWPLVPTFLEIESGSEAEVRKVVADLGLHYDDGMFGPVSHVYEVMGKNIEELKKLTF